MLHIESSAFQWFGPSALKTADAEHLTFSSWLPFFTAVAGVSVVLFSVMFLALQFKSEVWHESRLKRAVAIAALAELMIPFLAAIISLMASNPWRIAAWITGGFGVTIVLFHWYSYIRNSKTARKWDHVQAATAPVSLMLYVGVICAGFISANIGLPILAGILTWLLFSGASESWILLAPGGDTEVSQEEIALSSAQHKYQNDPSEATGVDADVPPARKEPQNETLQPLSTEVFKRRIVDLFSDGYMTLVAIIQGAVFGLLAIITGQQLESHHEATLQSAAIVAQAAVVFTAIIVVTHQYLLLTTMVRWTPSVLDTLIPYILGAGELAMAVTIGYATAWWGSLTFLFIAAIFSFWHTLQRATLEVFGGKVKVYGSFRRSLKQQIGSCGALALVSVAAMMLNLLRVGSGWIDATLPWAIAIGGIAVEVLGEIDQNNAYDELGIPRWRIRMQSAAPSNGSSTTDSANSQPASKAP